MRRLTVAAVALLALCGCGCDAAVPDSAGRQDIPLGPPPFGVARENASSPLERAKAILKDAPFSFAPESQHIRSLKLVMAEPDGADVLRGFGQSRERVPQLYAWCGLVSLDPVEAAAIRSRLLAQGGQVMVFDADLHHRQNVAVVIRRASDSGFCAALGPAQALDPWVDAERRIVRLRPAAFPDVPRVVRDDLERRGCRIPQVPDGARWQNIVSGRFTAPRVIDWAALCSRDGESAILVYPRGEPRGVLELARQSDKEFLQQDVDAIVYSRQISVAAPARIRVRNPPSIVPGLPRFDHDGVSDAFVEKGSTIWFHNSGRWLKLPGSD